MKTYWRSGGMAPPPTSALDGAEWSTSRPGRPSPKDSHGTHWIGGWVGPRAALDTVARRKRSHPLSGIEPSSSHLKSWRYIQCAAAVAEMLVSFRNFIRRHNPDDHHEKFTITELQNENWIKCWAYLFFTVFILALFNQCRICWKVYGCCDLCNSISDPHFQTFSNLP
jgi:hypothetical protein